MQIDANPHPALPIPLAHPLYKFLGRRLCFDAVHTHRAPKLNCQAQLGLENGELMRERDAEGRQLQGITGRVAWGREGKRHAYDAVQADLAEECGGMGSQIFAKGGHIR